MGPFLFSFEASSSRISLQPPGKALTASFFRPKQQGAGLDGKMSGCGSAAQRSSNVPADLQPSLLFSADATGPPHRLLQHLVQNAR